MSAAPKFAPEWTRISPGFFEKYLGAYRLTVHQAPDAANGWVWHGRRRDHGGTHLPGGFGLSTAREAMTEAERHVRTEPDSLAS